MSTYGVREFIQAAQRRSSEIDRELAEIQQRLQQSFERRQELLNRKEQAEHDLVSAMLPDFTPESLRRARDLSGFHPLNEDLIARMEQERQALQARVAAIETDPRFLDRERLRHPVTGELTLAMQRLSEHRSALLPLVEKCEAHPRFKQLIEAGYSTPQYKVGFWRLSYYLDWKAGDEVMAAFPDRKSFARLREEYLENRRALDDLEPRWQELKTELEEGAQLESEQAAARARLQNLETLHLEEARKKLAEFLGDCPEGALGTRLQRYPELETMAKRWCGLTEQARYLERVNELQMHTLVADLQKEKAKLGKDVAKYSRPKHNYLRFPQSTFDQRFGGRREKVRKRLDRYGQTVESVYIFDDYDRGSLAESFLWWDLVTDGQVDGSFIPEVREYYQRHPGYRYERSRKEDDFDVAADHSGLSSSTLYDAS